MASTVSPQWRFILANSVDMSHVGELSGATNRSLTLVHNRAGSLGFRLSMADNLAPYIWPLTSAIKAYRKGSDGTWKLVWSGFVWTIDEDVSGGFMTVNVIGWLQWLALRIVRRDKVYTANNPATGSVWKDYEIVYDLLSEINAATLTWDSNYIVPTVWSDPSAPLTKYPTPILPGVASAGAGDWSTHGRQYTVTKGAQVLAEVQKLTDLENGLDIAVNPATRRLDTYAAKMIAQTSAVFGYGWGPSNLTQFGRQIDPSDMINYMLAMGGDSTINAQFADTKLNPSPTQNPPLLGENAMETYGLIEQTVALSGAKTSAILATYAGAEVMLRSSPRILYSMTPIPFTLSLGPGRVPEPFVDYTVGDKVYLTAKSRGRIQIENQGVRVFGITITPDDNGNEIIGQLQVTPT